MLGSTIVIDNGLYKGHISVTFSVFVVKEMGKTYRRITVELQYILDSRAKKDET